MLAACRRGAALAEAPIVRAAAWALASSAGVASAPTPHRCTTYSIAPAAPAGALDKSVNTSSDAQGAAAAPLPHPGTAGWEPASASAAAYSAEEVNVESTSEAAAYSAEEVDAESTAAGVERSDALVSAALRHVPRLLWSHAALLAGADDLGLSPAAAGLVGSSDVEFVQAFAAQCNRRLARELTARTEQLASLRVRERVALGVRLRLEMLAPYIDSWPRALALLAAPPALPRTLALYAQAADAIWHAAGDTSTDYNWYTKRALLVGVYAATEFFMLTDCSPGYADTWAALDRRIEEVLQLGQAARDPVAALGSLGGAVSGALVQAAQLLAETPAVIDRASRGPDKQR